MPFPLETPAEITRRMEARMEASIIAIRPDADPAAIARSVRSPRGMLAAIIRVQALELYQVQLHLRWWGDQYFPDRAEDAQLERHASIWGITRRPATKAIGRATLSGAPETAMPADTLLRGAGSLTYEVVSAATLDGSGAATIDVRAQAAGSDSNTAAGTRLSLVTALDGLTVQEAVVDADGVTGGAPIETNAALLTRLLAEIQEPAHGGASFDYPRWIQNAFAASHVRCLPNWVGAGTVGVVVAMGTAEDPRVPTSAELDAMHAHIETVRPVTGEIFMLAAELLPCALTLAVDPYSAAVKTAAAASATAFFAREAKIGTRIYRSRLSEAISAASGEYRHDMPVPAGDITPGALQLPVPGPITWQAPS